MKKKYILAILIFTFLNVNNVFSQVGIGTTFPDAQLDIRSSNQLTPANTDGILIPKVDAFPLSNPTIAQQSMLVYLTAATTFGGNPKTIGFYYWDNPTTDWIGISSAANGDHDWYEEGTTTAPNAITDDMFHTGNVAIGKNTANFPLEVNTTAFDTGINNLQVNNSNNLLKAIENTVNGTGTGSHYGVYNTISGTGTGAQFGISNNISNSTDDAHYGIYNLLSGNGTGSHYGNWNSLQSNGNGFQYGNYNEITNTGTGSHFGNNNILSGTGVGDQFANYNTISNTGLGNHYGNYTLLNGTGIGLQYANLNTISNSGNGIHYGNYNVLNGSGTGIHYGNSIELNGTGTGNQFGNYTHIDNSGNGSHYGNYNLFDDSGSGARVGFLANLTGTNTGTQYGLDVTIDSPGNFNHYGSAIRMGGTGAGFHWANYTIIAGVGNGGQAGFYSSNTNSGNGTHYGTWNIVQGTGTGIKYGSYNIIPTTAGGTNYGIYSEVLKAGATNFAGYFLGNVGIGTTTANTYTLPPSRGTNGQIMRTNGTGVVTWANNSDFAWSTTGNAGTNGGTIIAAGTNFIGTTDNQNIDFRTNNTFRGRFSNLGEFFVGTLNTVLTGDLMNGVGNVTFPWAVNGYTAFNGAGTYGQVTSGTTIFAGVQGEYNGTNAQGAGVRGLALTGTSGSAFISPHTGVSGGATTTGSYKFGTYGSGGASARSGGVLGNDFGVAMGALGYYSSGLLDYAVYGFGLAHANGVAGGRMSNNFSQKNTTIGLGIYGGVMGGWVRGMKYGFHTKGDTYSLYVDGNGYTNKPLAYLIGSDGQDKVASFMSTSMKPEVTVNGKVTLTNGKVFVAFDRSFQQIISNIDDVIITASPQGKSNGVYIDNITKNGFWIMENNDGVSNIKISWIAITKIKGEENPEVPTDLLAKDFDKKMDGVMFNDNNLVDTPQSLWWDGSKIRWDKPTNDKVDTETEKIARPKGAKK